MKLLFVGLDAFDPVILREGAASGAFPALAALIGRATSAETETDRGTYVGSLWATVHTGVGPERHGLYCWAEMAPGTYDIRLADERRIAVPSFWTRLSEAGFRSAVIDVPHCKLDPAINGAHVINWLTHFKTVEGFATAPAALADDIERRFGLDPYPHCNDVDHSPAGLADFTEALLKRVEWRTELMLDLIRSGGYDLAALTYGESHCVGHQCYHLHDPHYIAHDGDLAAGLGDPLMRVYAAIDRAVGRLTEAVPADCAIVVLASHGMGSHYDGSHLADRLIRRVDRSLKGFPAIPVGRRLLDAVEGSRLRRYLGPLARLLPAKQPRRAHARAFMVPNNEAYLGIRINLAGREPAGLVRPEDYGSYLNALESTMMTARRPHDGSPAFTLAVRSNRDHGADHRTSGLPDLMLAWERSKPYEALEVPGIARLDGRPASTRSGDHREGGLVLIAGPSGRAVNLPPRLASHEIAPLILARFGVTATSGAAAESHAATPPPAGVAEAQRATT